jgi:hypothetical protein
MLAVRTIARGVERDSAASREPEAQRRQLPAIAPLATMSYATGRVLATVVNPDEARRRDNREFRVRSGQMAISSDWRGQVARGLGEFGDYFGSDSCGAGGRCGRQSPQSAFSPRDCPGAGRIIAGPGELVFGSSARWRAVRGGPFGRGQRVFGGAVGFCHTRIGRHFVAGRIGRSRLRGGRERTRTPPANPENSAVSLHRNVKGNARPDGPDGNRSVFASVDPLPERLSAA